MKHRTAAATFVAAIICAGCAVIDSAGTASSDRDIYQLRAWALHDRAAAESRTTHHRLVGIGCGMDGLTMTAAEEDHFPFCEAIDTPEAFCGFDQGDLPLAYECARYLGDFKATKKKG